MLNIKKVSLLSLIVCTSLFSFNKASKSLASDADVSNICSGFESQKIYAVPTANNMASCPSEDSKIIYVSTSGNDNNNGISPNSPVKTLSKAIKLIRTNSSDWIVLKRGETFNDSFGVVRSRKGEKPLGGKYIHQPLVITSYGELLERPIIQPQKNGIDLWGPFQNITISGLEFYSEPGTGGTAIRTLGEGSNYVIHNNYINGFSAAAIIQGKQQENRWFSNVLIKDNILVNSASSGQGHSQGIFVKATEKLVIDGNVFDTCGWYKDRNGRLTNSRAATIFNHCIYLQYGGYPAQIKNNIITRASSHGLQARSGAFVKNNLFARNPIQFFISSQGLNGNANPIKMFAKNNVILEGVDINHELPRGLGIQHNNAYLAQYENNIIAHLLASSKGSKKAIEIVCKTDDRNTSISGSCQSLFKHNLVFNWGNELTGDLISAKNFNNNLSIQHSFQENVFIAVAKGIKFTDFRKEVLKGRYNFNGNTYISSNLTNKELFSLPGQPKVTFRAWKKNIETTAKGMNDFDFVDPCRTMATYYDDLILGDTQDNCTIMHNSELFEQFINLAKQKNSIVARSGIDINSVINYIREGFVVLPAKSKSVPADY